MTAKNFSCLAALIFALIAVLQFARALSGWPITISIPEFSKNRLLTRRRTGSNRLYGLLEPWFAKSWRPSEIELIP
jgi:hypothetical protein